MFSNDPPGMGDALSSVNCEIKNAKTFINLHDILCKYWGW